MSRQSPGRNGRNQGLKVKHVLQISLLLGVGIWLLYQLQQPFDRKSVVEVDKFSDNVSGTIDLGRKDLKNDMRTEEEEEKRVVDHSDEELNSEVENKPEDLGVREVASMVEDTGGESSNEENNDKVEEIASNESDDVEIADVKPENEGSETGNHEVEIKEEDAENRENDGDHLQNNDGEKMEENGSKDDDEGKEKEVENIQILGAKENGGESEFMDKKIEETVEENTSNETTAETKDQEIKIDEGKQEVQEDNHSDVSSESQEGNDVDQGKISGEEAEWGNKNSTSNSSLLVGQAENRSNETDEGAKELRETGEAEKEKLDRESSDGSGVSDKQNKVETNSDNNSIPTEDTASNGTIPEQTKKSNTSSENSGLDSTGKADDTNGNLPASHNDTALTEITLEKSSTQEMDEKPSATNNDSGNNTSESQPDDIQNSQLDSSINSALQEEKDAQTDIDTLLNSGNGDNSHQEAIAK